MRMDQELLDITSPPPEPEFKKSEVFQFPDKNYKTFKRQPNQRNNIRVKSLPAKPVSKNRRVVHKRDSTHFITNALEHTLTTAHDNQRNSIVSHYSKASMIQNVIANVD